MYYAKVLVGSEYATKMARDLNSAQFTCWRLRLVNKYGFYFTLFNSVNFEMLQLLFSEVMLCRT